MGAGEQKLGKNNFHGGKGRIQTVVYPQSRSGRIGVLEQQKPDVDKSENFGITGKILRT